MNLTYGSRGDEVKKLQQTLNSAGYQLAEDGIYGQNTQAAVKDYQTKNGLSADGIAGTQTLGKLYNTASTGTQTQATEATQQTQQPAQTAPDYSQYAYDASADKAYQEALAALQQAQQSLPSYKGTYDQQLQDIYNQIVNRDKFSYDLNSDMLYQQYADQYTQQGKMAMMDTMGQAAALTGGYASSYGQAVGQQQYDAYLQQLNDVVPELYGMALDQYNQEGQDMLNQYAMVGDMADDEYGKYQDSLNQYWQNLSYLKGQADDAYNMGYENWYNSYQMGINADNIAYERQQDAYSKLIALITSTGYAPTAEELAAAGMSQAEADAYKKLYGGGSVGGPGVGDPGDDDSGANYDNRGFTKAEVQRAQSFVGAEPDGKWGEQAAAYAKAEGYDSLEAVIVALRESKGDVAGAGSIAGPVKLPNPSNTKNTTQLINSHMTKQEALSRGVTEKEYTAMTIDWINHADLSDGEIRYLLQYYGLE